MLSCSAWDPVYLRLLHSCRFAHFTKQHTFCSLTALFFFSYSSICQLRLKKKRPTLATLCPRKKLASCKFFLYISFFCWKSGTCITSLTLSVLSSQEYLAWPFQLLTHRALISLKTICCKCTRRHLK